MTKILTQELVQHLFNYDPETGLLTWKNPTNKRISIGAFAGTESNGYYNIKIYRKNYRVHRIIWLYVHGYFPENEIDHIDRNKKNNKIINLREVSRQCNLRNTGTRADNKSGVVGVSLDKKSFKWLSRITVDKKKYRLCFCSDYIEAVCARLAAEQCLDWPECDSNSTAYQCVNNWLNRD